MKAKKLIALLFCIVMTLVVFSVTSYAADCTHPDGFEWVTTSQTCSQEGVKKLTCRTCGYVQESEVIPAHNYEVVYTGKEATCTEQGSVTKFCSWCMSLANEITPKDAENHSYGNWIVDVNATCETEGSQHRVCERCSYVDTQAIPVDLTKHVADENSVWTTITPAECYAAGTESTTCTVCSKTFTRSIPIHSDAGNDADKYTFLSETLGNCTVPGAKNYLCIQCSVTVSVPTQVQEDNHDYSGEWLIIEEATCTEAGKRVKYCLNNHAHKVNETYYSNHDYSVEVSFTPGATCTASGSKVMKCANCDAEKTVETAPEHVYGEWVLNGSCSGGGTATKTCLCGAKTETTSYASGTHLNYTVLADVKPTCKYIGYQDIRCTNCNTQTRIFPDDYKATGHTLSEWITTEAATCSKSGVMIRECEVCDEVVEEKVIQQLNHKYIVLAKGSEATCTETGVSDYLYCTQCHEEVKPAVIEAYGHNFVEQNFNGSSSELICNRCYQYKVGEEGEEPVMCDCLCHNSDGIAGSLYKIMTFFNKLLGRNQYCECGAQHYESTSIFEDIFGPILELFK